MSWKAANPAAHMLIDANILLYSVDSASPFHGAARAWLEQILGGTEPVGIPWASIGAFLRISTNPRVNASPLTSESAWSYVAVWMSSPASWVPPASRRTVEILGDLVTRHDVRDSLVPDAQLAALAVDHGLEIQSVDTDFHRFPEVRHTNPLK